MAAVPLRGFVKPAAFAAALLLACRAGAGETVQTLVEKARSADPAARIEAIGRLGMLRAEEGLPAIREAAATGEVETRVAAIEALGIYARDDQLAFLGAFVNDADSRIAGAAARALGRGAFKALPFLIDALRHESPGVREAAESAMQRASGVRADGALLAEAARKSRGDRFVFLAAILEGGANPRASADAIRALPDAPESAAVLVKELAAEFEPVREAARKKLESLACRRLDDAGWREWLREEPRGPVLTWRSKSLRDPANPLRAAAARALAIPQKAAVEALFACAADGVVEEEALKSLAVATGLRPRPRAEWIPWWSANRDRSRTEWLLAALIETADAPNRASAARALAGEREKSVVSHLIAYGLKDPDAVVRIAVAESLSSLLKTKCATAAEWESAWNARRESWK
ncbi:MAG: HEAT repeat domain-containing protein [Planctomycetes bacterium]|nr:HEAT repeat domain-containing protein [Planctomycetota bacterium]